MKEIYQSHNPADALRDLWIELQLAPSGAAVGACPGSRRGTSSGRTSGSRAGSGSGSGSCGAGYGLGLIVPDHFSRERILRIMEDLCAIDAAKRRV